MRCQLCGDAAGWWRRRCSDCRRLWAVWGANRLAGMRGLLAAFAQTNVPDTKIGRFLEAEPYRGQGTIRDLIAADMANQLLDALGQKGNQHGAGVKQLRERGGWKHLGQRPSE